MNSAQLKYHIDAIVATALAEDVGSGDPTALACIPPQLSCTARFVTRQPCTVAGLAVAAAVFAHLDPACRFQAHVQDGEGVSAGSLLAVVTGPARAILTGERSALNLLQRLSATATLTRRFVDAVAGTRAKILDTRKTTPGLRHLEKYAVACGGGTNHRMGLYDMVMIKDNHRELASALGPGGILRCVQAARQAYPHLRVEVEADSIQDVEEAIAAQADVIMLDNMSLEDLRHCVDLVAGRIPLEASGGVNLNTVADIAATGVDFISVGALTHSAPAIDIGLDISPGL